MVTNTSGITSITVKGHAIKIKFGLPACQVFSEMCLADDSEKYISGSKMLALGMATLLLAAYENQCMIDDITPTYTRGTFIEFVEDTLIDDPGEAERIMEVFSNSRFTVKLLDQVEEVINDGKKKLSIGSLSNLSPSTNLVSRKKNTTVVPSASSSSAKRGTNATKAKKRKPKKR